MQTSRKWQDYQPQSSWWPGIFPEWSSSFRRR